MPLSYVIHTGNGATTNFNVPFPYLDRSHVGVKVNGATVSFTWINSNTVQVTPAPANAAKVEVRRTTPSAPLVTYNDGSTLLGADLNQSNKQNSYLNEEAQDRSADAIVLDSQDRMDARNKRIANVADPIDPQDAATKAYVDPVIATATTQANNAANSAAAALASENNADAARIAAENARNDAQAAAATLPVATLGNADRWLKINVGGTGWSYRTNVELLGDIGAVPTARTLTAGSGLTGGGDLSANRTLSVNSAVVALLAGVQAFTGAKRYTPVTLTDQANIAWDLDAAPLARVTLAGNRTVAAPTNQRDGGMFVLIVNQDSGGNRTLAWNAAFDFGTEGTPVLPTGSNKVAIFTFLSNGTSMRCIGRWNN